MACLHRTVISLELYRNECISCHAAFGEYHCGVCNLWMSLVSKVLSPVVKVAIVLSHVFAISLFHLPSPKNPFTAINAAFAVWVALNPSATVPSVACASRSVSCSPISASRTNTRTAAQFVAKTCSRHVSPRRTCRAAMPFTRTASANSLVSTTAAPFAKRPW
jgi:hypothetical protein